MTSRLTNLLTAALAVVLALPAFAAASWNSNGSGNGYAEADLIPAGSTPSASVFNRSVTVSWTGTGGSMPLQGYVVKRYSAGGAEEAIGSNCTGIVNGTSCTEDSVPPGNWRYSVAPARQNWRGNESGQSPAVSVNAPALTVLPTNVTSLPQTLTGQVTSFVPDQTVTFRLDDPTTGQVLTGSIMPSPVPANGTAGVSVTLPNGTSNGSHTIYAIGSGTDVASANFTVAVAPTTITTSAFDFDDASTGIEIVRNEPNSYASDGVTETTGNFPAGATSNTRYVEYVMNSALRAGQSVSSANFNFRYAAAALGLPTCFYIEVRTGTGTVLSTHGSNASPAGCVTGTSQTNFTVPLSSVTSTSIANDLVIRVYGRAAVLGGFTVDRATVTGSGTDGSFELFPRSRTDRANGTATTTPWVLAADDDVFHTSNTNWQSAYSSTRYLKATFPAYVPAGATIQSATLTHVYRSNSVNQGVCSYVEIFNGNASIGTHGSSVSDLSCSPSNASDVTDTISLPEVDTVAEANNVSARIYMRRNGNTQSRHDQVRLSVTYVK